MGGQSMAKQMEVLLKSVRKWDTDFLCIGNKNESFSVPQPEDITPRIMANLEYFRVNYAVCLALFALVSIVIYPRLLVLVCVFRGCGMLFTPGQRTRSLRSEP